MLCSYPPVIQPCQQQGEIQKTGDLKKKMLFGAKETEQVYKTLNNFQVKTKKNYVC